METITRMESIDKTAEIFGIPKHYVRTLVKEGKVRAVRVSRARNAKILVNIQSVNDYFNSTSLNEEPVLNTDGIQPIPVELLGTSTSVRG